MKFLPIAMLIFLSCGLLFPPDHELSVDNLFPDPVNNIKVGDVDFGNLATGESSDYKKIDDGDHKVTGSTKYGDKLDQSITLSGWGSNSWTLTIQEGGQLDLNKDD